MKKKLSAVLLAAYLMAGCSSGGGTSGAGGGGLITAGEFLLAAAMTITGGPSIDIIQDICNIADDGEITFEVFTSKLGTFTVTVTNITDLTGGLFPSGLIINRYTVNFVARSPGAPVLSPRIFNANSVTVNGGNNTFDIVIADLAVTKLEAANQNPGGVVHSYSVNVTAQGRTLSGDNFSITATAFVEMGNFDLCGGN